MDTFQKNFDAVITELQSFCDSFLIKGVPPEYEGIWVPDNEIKAWAIPPRSGQILKALVLASRAQTILELGTSFGYSTLWLGLAAKHNEGKVYTIELAKPKIATAAKYFEKAGLREHIAQLEGRITEQLNAWTRPIDFVFLDADKANYYAYLQQIEPHLKKGSVVVADNACDYGHLMEDFIKYLSTNEAYLGDVVNIDHGLMIAVKIK
jgi:predicted O-methyltransferase YrrM